MLAVGRGEGEAAKGGSSPVAGLRALGLLLDQWQSVLRWCLVQGGTARRTARDWYPVWHGGTACQCQVPVKGFRALSCLILTRPGR